MKRFISAVLLVTFLNGCSLPLVGSLTSSTVTGVATGNYQRSLVSTGIDFSVHKSTGKTPGQHLYAMAKNKYTEKKLKKHFPNEEFKIKDFQLSWNFDYPVAPTMASLNRPDKFLFYNYN